jgi:hypothetical protein
MSVVSESSVGELARITPLPWKVAIGSVVVGLAISVLWSYHFVDSVIGDNVANSMLGHDAKTTAITGTVAGLVFAFVSGLAGTFTACNVAMVSAIGPMSRVGASEQNLVTQQQRLGLRLLVRPVLLLMAGMLAVSCTYGFIGVILGNSLPQLSTDTAWGMPVRLLQASIVFGIVGFILLWMGLGTLGFFRDIFAQRPISRVVFLGALVGTFVVGRPFPLFNRLFHWAVDQENPLIGALAFGLQSLGNVALISIVYVTAILLTKGRFLRWLTASHRRTMVISGSLLICLGAFTVFYWTLRVPAMFGFGWFPSMPYT